MRFEGPTVPEVGAPLSSEGKIVGSVTSASFSPGWGVPIGLAYVRVAQATAGSSLVAVIEGIGEVPAIVSELPMIPPLLIDGR